MNYDIGLKSKHSFARARLWLFERLSSQLELDHAEIGDSMRMLLGCWLCEYVARRTVKCDALSDLVEGIHNSLGEQTKAGTFDPFQYDTKLLLLTHNILAIYGCSAPGIDRFAQQVSQAISELPIIPPRFIGEALLLANLGYNQRPPVHTLEAHEAGMNSLSLLQADEHRVRSVCQNVSSATHFGAQPLRAPAGVRSYLGRILPIVLLQSLREYNLELSMILLRTTHFLKANDRRTTDLVLDFLLDQQLADGKFGHFAIEEAKFNETNANSYDLANKLYLPITVSCVWALAEVCRVNLFSLRRV